MKTISVRTDSRECLIDVTAAIRQAVEGWDDGAVHIFSMHTTCGLTINENADPDVKLDLMQFFQKLAPRRNNWRHQEGNTDAHIRSSLLGVSLLVPLNSGQLVLGTWQSIYLYEADGPRTRRLVLNLLKTA